MGPASTAPFCQAACYAADFSSIVARFAASASDAVGSSVDVPSVMATSFGTVVATTEVAVRLDDTVSPPPQPAMTNDSDARVPASAKRRMVGRCDSMISRAPL